MLTEFQIFTKIVHESRGKFRPFVPLARLSIHMHQWKTYAENYGVNDAEECVRWARIAFGIHMTAVKLVRFDLVVNLL